MASGVTVLPSTSGGGKSSDGSRLKRKIASGLPNVGKKVCVSKDTVKAEVNKSAVSSRPSLTKRKERLDDENSGDSSPELDAARALTMFSQFVERPPSPQKKSITVRRESVSPLLQWSRKRRRSSRAKRADCSSEDSHTNSEPPVEQQSEAASSLGKDSHSAFTPVKVEAPSGSVEQGCASDTEKQNNKVLSDSSCDFQQLDSRAESPTSPLPASVSIDEVPGFAVYPKLEGGRSAFQKVVPIRPVKKPAAARKPKVEDKSYEAATPEQAPLKLVARKKPKPTGFGQLPVVKTEDADAGWTLSTPSLVPNTRFEDTECANPSVAAAEEKPLPEPVLVKIETKPAVKPGQRSGKLKPAVSESEKEARRQRRVQANRESARQTIRRKQVLCEELSAKSQHLSNENELLRQELKIKLLELKGEEEISLHLKDQLAKCDEGAAGSEFAASPSEKPANWSAFKYPLPPVSFGQMPMPPMHQMQSLFWYAQAYAQATGMQQAGDIALALSGEYASALSNFAMGVPPGYWVGLAQGGSQGGRTSVLPHYFAHPSIVSTASKFPPVGEEASSPPGPSNPAVSLPATQAEGSFSLAACGRDRGLASSKSIGAYGARAFPDSSVTHDPKSIAKCESACEGSTFGSKGFFKLNSVGSQAGMPTACIGGVLSRKTSGEEMLCLSSATAHLARASSGNLGPHISKISNSRYMFTNGGRRYPDMTGQDLPAMMVAPKPSGASAKAAEARRRRREVQRSRSLLHRQAARVAEPPMS